MSESEKELLFRIVQYVLMALGFAYERILSLHSEVHALVDLFLFPFFYFLFLFGEREISL